jgi:hypothetical protein
MSTLRSLFYRHNTKNVALSLEWFKNNDEAIRKDVAELKDATRHTTLTALTVLIPEHRIFPKLMNESSAVRKKEASSQKKSERETLNWKSFDEVKQFYNQMSTFVKPHLSHKGELTQPEFNKLQDYVILSLCCGIWVPPRRSADWTEMLIRLDKVDKDTDNYIEKKQFVFNRYKTAKTYGTQHVNIPAGLMKILNAYIRHNPYDYLLVDGDGNKISSAGLAQRLNRIFGNKISTSLLRHIYLSDKYKDVPKLTDMEQTAQDMAHSLIESLQYVRNS